ncbi:MAG: PIN domain-containing protein [Pirellulales bacterium]
MNRCRRSRRTRCEVPRRCRRVERAYEASAKYARAIKWLRRNESELAIRAIVFGELEYGIQLLPNGRRRTRLRQWFTQGIERIRALDFDIDAASAWATLLVRLKHNGTAMPIKDSLIAATALAHGLTVATRNVVDFRNAGVRVVNPFQD